MKSDSENQQASIAAASAALNAQLAKKEKVLCLFVQNLKNCGLKKLPFQLDVEKNVFLSILL